MVAGNLIGTDASGRAEIGNGHGVRVIGNQNRVGTDGNASGDEFERNVISGNRGVGVGIYSAPNGLYLGNDNVVAGNYIGTDISGMQMLGNESYGVSVSFLWETGGPNALSPRGNVIGGSSPIERNVVAGSLSYGILLDDAVETQLLGNYIGTNAAGNASLPNNRGPAEMDGGSAGVMIVQASRNRIGGASPGEGNLISGNNGSGVVLWYVGTDENQLQGNLIGTDSTGVSGLGNTLAGIGIVNASGTQILANTIARNQSDGITVTGSAADNTIRQNRIFSNGGLGIDLENDGVTPNDNGSLDTGVVADLDLGPNSLQNFPELQNVQPGSETRVTGQLRSTPGQSFVLDFYASPAADPTGFGEGQRWLGETTVVANEEGVAGFNVRLAAATFGGEFVTATATRLRVDGSESDTSEFSAAIAIKAGKGVRGPDRFTLELVPDAGGDPSGQRFTTFNVELIGALDATDAFTPIDVAAFTTTISHSPLGPVGLPVSLATDATSNSPWLMGAVSRGTTFGQVVLVGQSTIDGIPYEFARWTLDNVRLGSFATRDFARDEFTLVYDRLAYLYTPLTMFGAPGTPVEGVWDVTATGGVVPVSLPEQLVNPIELTDVQYFAEIPGIAGDATLVGYAGWIKSRSVDFALLGADDSAGAPAFAGTIGVIADAGSASPRLMEAVASGRQFAAPIKIAAVRTIANDVIEFARWELDGASLVSYASASGRRDGFAITFDALHYSFADSGPDGRPLPPHSATLDRSAQGIDVFARDVALDAITPASDAKTLLARIPGAQGESQLVGYAGWTPVKSFQFQLERPLTESGDAGAPYATSFSILMPTGRSSPRLFELTALGTVLSEPVQVALVEGTKNGVFEFARWTLAGPEIGDYATAAATQDAVTVGYDQLTYQTQRPTVRGGTSAPIVGQWNAAAAGSQPYNVPLDPSDELVLTNNVRLFVEFPGITGDGQAVGYVGWVPVDSYAFDLTNPLDIAGTPALASAFRFSARSGQASPQLQRALLEGRTFATVNVVAVRQTNAGKLEEFARWKLSHAQVASYATDSLLADTFEVSFDALENTFGAASTKKGALAPVTGRWDLQATGSEVSIRGSLVPDAVIPSDVRVLMQVPGIVGASQLAGYQGWIPLEAAGLTLARHSTSSQDVVLVSSFGIATSAGPHSPLVIDALARQHVYGDDAPVRIVTLNTRDQDNIYETARWTLSDARFTYYANQDLRQDAFAVAYDAWDLVYTPSTSRGAAGVPIHLEWDVDGTVTQLVPAGAPLAAAAASTEIKLFLNVPGIAGDSLRAGYVGWIQVNSAQFGIEQLRGARALSWATPLFLELPTGLSSPLLMAAAASGMHMPYVELVALHDPLSFEIARLRLDDVQWTHFVTRDARHDIVALTYDRLTLTWNNEGRVSGMPSTTTEGHWPAATLGDPLGSAEPLAGRAEVGSSASTYPPDASSRDTDWSSSEKAHWHGPLEAISGQRVKRLSAKAQEFATDMALDSLMHEWWDEGGFED